MKRIPLLLCLFSPATAFAVDCAGADLIFRNGKFVTMDAQRTIAKAMALRDGRISAIGNDAAIAKCVGPATRTIDLAGTTVLPGLIDVHTHAQEWAKSVVKGEIDAGYPDVKSIAQIVELVRQRAAKAAPGEWIVGFAWDDSKLKEKRYITRHDLDAAAPEHPVYLVHISGHLSVANSKALALAEVTQATPDPHGGVIEHDTKGQPTGILKDTAMPLVGHLLPPDPPDLAARAARLATEEAVKYGLTTMHDIWVSPDDMRGYQQAYASGGLKARVQIVPGVRNLKDAEQVVRLGLHTGFGDEHLKLGGVKMFADGGMGARTIAIYPPGVIGEPDNVGLLLWKSEDMQKAHQMLAANGWQLITHAIGDRAIDQVLDSYAAAMRELKLDAPRFRIAHCGVSTPVIQKRLRELKVMVDGNPPFAYWIGSWFRKYGPARVRWSYPGKSYFDNAIVAGGASDVGVTPISPWWGIWAAVERREMETGEVLAPEERLTVQQALELYTRNGAYIGREEDRKGSLEAGKFADFIVLDRDVLTIPADELKDVKVVATYVDGKPVYRADSRLPSP